MDSGPNYLGEEIDKRLDSGDRNVGFAYFESYRRGFPKWTSFTRASIVFRRFAGAARHATIRIGSEQDKELFCRMLLDTYDPYKPAVIPWPKLDDTALARLTGLPIWRSITPGAASPS